MAHPGAGAGLGPAVLLDAEWSKSQVGQCLNKIKIKNNNNTIINNKNNNDNNSGLWAAMVQYIKTHNIQLDTSTDVQVYESKRMHASNT